MKKAGVEGIEPSHVGTKNRCLTTWLYSTWCVWSLFVSTIKYEERDFCVVHECGRDFLVKRVLCTKMRKPLPYSRDKLQVLLTLSQEYLLHPYTREIPSMQTGSSSLVYYSIKDYTTVVFQGISIQSLLCTNTSESI